MNGLVRIGIGIAAAGIFAGAAQAHGVNWSLSVGVPGFGFYAPAPVYAPPVVVAPAPYYYAPPPRVYYAPAYVAPAPVWVAPRHRPHRHWDRGGRGHRYYGR